jgi:hypothetical protein
MEAERYLFPREFRLLSKEIGEIKRQGRSMKRTLQ